LTRGRLGAAAHLLGTTRRLLELTLAHATDRTQFGVPIGSFQAVRHRLADVHVELDLARSAVWSAACELEEGLPSADTAVLCAAVTARRAFSPRRPALPPGARRHRFHLGAPAARPPQAGAHVRRPVRHPAGAGGAARRPAARRGRGRAAGCAAPTGDLTPAGRPGGAAVRGRTGWGRSSPRPASGGRPDRIAPGTPAGRRACPPAGPGRRRRC
ncbi:hypothetical protein A7K94_0204530, partial [Modestobacter sp. VKM Ac-2676]